MAWQIAYGPLDITKEERAIPRSDWGPLDGASDPSSEPEQIEVREPQSDASDDTLDDEDVIIPTEGDVKSTEAVQVLLHALSTDDLPPSIPRPRSRNTRLPSISTIMATTTATQTTHIPTIGRSSGGGGGSGGGGFGGGPPGGAGGPPGGGGGGPPPGGVGPGPGQAAGGAKLMGNPPQIFDGERERTQLFLSQWEIY